MSKLERRITLPWPPSANRYWRHPNKGRLAGRSLISREGRAYRRHVQWLVSRDPMGGRLSVEIDAYPPDRRRRDLDNILKAALDALTAAGAWHDDSQVDRLSVARCEKEGKGQIVVVIKKL